MRHAVLAIGAAALLAMAASSAQAQVVVQSGNRFRTVEEHQFAKNHHVVRYPHGDIHYNHPHSVHHRGHSHHDHHRYDSHYQRYGHPHSAHHRYDPHFQRYGHPHSAHHNYNYYPYQGSNVRFGLSGPRGSLWFGF